MILTIIPVAFALAGCASMGLAIVNERRMHRHRRPGVTYAQATFRRDGGWRRTDLFFAPGLAFQRQASRYGMLGALLWILALLSWIAITLLSAQS